MNIGVLGNFVDNKVINDLTTNSSNNFIGIFDYNVMNINNITDSTLEYFDDVHHLLRLVDTVYITDSTIYLNYMIKASGHNLNIILETPSIIRKNDFQLLERMNDIQNISITTSCLLRYRNILNEIKRLLEEDLIGELHSITLNMKIKNKNLSKSLIDINSLYYYLFSSEVKVETIKCNSINNLYKTKFINNKTQYINIELSLLEEEENLKILIEGSKGTIEYSLNNLFVNNIPENNTIKNSRVKIDEKQLKTIVNRDNSRYILSNGFEIFLKAIHLWLYIKNEEKIKIID
ncbi:hypothetical protein [Macrococcus animalis]|uniref:hypothetical protein n=1 Tax=Macrococcus animalis TaxID=3395467 RepID=UPI0039BE8D1E